MWHRKQNEPSNNKLVGPPQRRSLPDELVEQVRAVFVSCGHAVRGIIFALRSQRNFRIHLLSAAGVFSLGIVFRFSLVEMALLVLTVSLVMMGELLNTSLELTLNLLEARNHPVAKVAKDVAAGGVLLGVLGSIAIGLFLFLPKVLSLMECGACGH